MKLFTYGLILVSFLFTTNACKNNLKKSNKPDTLIHIPTDASMITAFNTTKLLQKADFKNVMKMAFYKDAVKELRNIQPLAAEIMEDPYSSGIDLLRNGYMYQSFAGDNAEKTFRGFTFSLANKTAFMALLKKAGMTDIKTKDNFNYFGNGKAQVMAWNDESIIIGMSTGSNNALAEAAKFFGTTKENSMASNVKLKETFAQSFDIASWAYSDQLKDIAMSDPSMGMGLGMLGLQADDLNGNYMSNLMNFEKGKIASSGLFDVKDNLKKLVSPLFKEKIATDFSKYIPKDNLNMLMTTGLNLGGLKNTPYGPQVLGMLSYQLNEFGLSFDDIAEALSGDVMFAGYNAPDGMTSGVIMATSIGNAAKFDKLLNLATQMNMLAKDGDSYTVIDNQLNAMLGGTYGPATMTIKDGIAFFTAKDSFKKGIKAGGFAKDKLIDAKTYNNLAGKIIGMQFIPEDIQSMGIEMSDFENITMDMAGNKMNFNVNMADKNSNSLSALFKMLNKIYLEQSSGSRM